MNELPPLPEGVRTLTSEESTRLRRLYPDLRPSPLDYPDTCMTCGGAGSFRWWGHYVADRGGNLSSGEVVEYRCPCVDQWMLHRFLLNANVKVLYQRLSWCDLTAVEDGAIAATNGWLANADAYIRSGIGLILHGAVGAGKSALATMLLKEQLGAGHDGYFITFSDLIDTIKQSWHEPEMRDWIIRRVRNAGILVLDDVGREHHQREVSRDGGTRSKVTTAMSESTLDELLRHRVAMSKPTILTTNHDLDKLEQNYGSNIISLIREQSASYRFEGADFRPMARNRKLDEAEAGLVRPVVLG